MSLIKSHLSAFDCLGHNKPWGFPPIFTCLFFLSFLANIHYLKFFSASHWWSLLTSWLTFFKNLILDHLQSGCYLLHFTNKTKYFSTGWKPILKERKEISVRRGIREREVWWITVSLGKYALLTKWWYFCITEVTDLFSRELIKQEHSLLHIL